MGKLGAMRPVVFGTVASINGTTLTVTGRQGFGTSSAAVTYTVDASSATVMKDNATSSVSAIATGDSVLIEGTVSGTNVTAKVIRDGVMVKGAPGAGRGGQNGSSTPAFAGNGEPVVAGSVSAVSGTTLTITNKSNVTYTVDATNAKIVEQGQATPVLSDIVVGDNVVVQGTVNGTTVTATTVINQKAGASAGHNASSTKDHVPGAPGQSSFGGLLGGIGSFFKHLFGF